MNLHKTNNRGSYGFTLIELLVVIAIISLLSSIVLASLNTVRVKSRNARRVADIAELRTAFNLALSAGGGFPIAPPSGWACISTTCYGDFNFSTDSTVDAFFTPYIAAKPSDPENSTRGLGGYIYRNPWPKSGNPITFQDGSVRPAGPYLVFFEEPPPGSTSCGPALVVYTTSTYTLCALPLES